MSGTGPLEGSHTITREFGFDMGHMLPDHEGGCYRPHGHRYRMEVTLDGTLVGAGPEHGMVMDFGNLKALVTEYVVDVLDHRFMLCATDPRFDGMVATFDRVSDLVVVAWPPTAENIAAFCGQQLTSWAGLAVARIDLWETPTCRATWTP